MSKQQPRPYRLMRLRNLSGYSRALVIPVQEGENLVSAMLDIANLIASEHSSKEQLTEETQKDG